MRGGYASGAAELAYLYQQNASCSSAIACTLQVTDAAPSFTLAPSYIFFDGCPAESLASPRPKMSDPQVLRAVSFWYVPQEGVLLTRPPRRQNLACSPMASSTTALQIDGWSALVCRR